MRANLPTNILYAGVCYACPTNKLAQMYIPFQRQVDEKDLEAIAKDFVPFVMQKTGEIHHFNKTDARISYSGDYSIMNPSKYEIVGPIEKRDGKEIQADKYTMGMGFISAKGAKDLVQTIIISVNDLTELSPRGGPMTLRENMGKVLEKYVKEMKN